MINKYSFKYYRFVLKGPCYNPMDVINALMTRRGYKVGLYTVWFCNSKDG